MIKVIAHVTVDNRDEIHFNEMNYEFVLGNDNQSDEYKDFLGTVTHEIGHVLGLAHSEDKDSIMYKYYSFDERKQNLLEIDDINGIQHLHGVRSKNLKFSLEFKKETGNYQADEFQLIGNHYSLLRIEQNNFTDEKSWKECWMKCQQDQRCLAVSFKKTDKHELECCMFEDDSEQLLIN
jgi:hypothetical protein